MKKVFQIKLKNITRVFALVIAVSLVTFTGCKSYDEDIANLETDIAALKTELTTLNTTTKAATDAQIAALTAEINTLKTKVATLESTGATDAEVAAAITAAKADIMSKVATLEAFNAYKTTNDAAIAALTTKVNAAATKADLDAAKADLNTQITGVKTTLTALGADVTAITAKVTGLTADVAKLTTDLGKVKGDVEARLAIIEGLLKISAGKSTVLDGFTASLADQLAKITANTSAITALQTSLTAEKAKIVTLQADVAKHTTDITALQASVTKINADITAIQASIVKINANLKTIASAMSMNFDVLSSRLSSLTYVPEFYVNGIEAMNFSPLLSRCKTITPDVTVAYHLNPSFITAADIETNNLGFVVLESQNLITGSYGAKAVETRVKANFVKIEGGKIYVNVSVVDFNTLLGATGGNIVGGSLEKFHSIALQVPLSEKAVKENALEFDANGTVVTIGDKTFPADRVITAQYVRMFHQTLTAQKDVYLAKKVTNYPAFPQTVAGAKALTIQDIDGATSTDPTVITLPYGTTKDLVNEVIAIYKNAGFDIAKYGLKFKFDLLELNETTGATSAIVYNRGSNNTDQQQFIKITDAAKGTIEAKVFTQAEIAAAQGRTPIVRVWMYNDLDPNCPVLNSYIKVYLAEKPLPTPVVIPFTIPDAVGPCTDAVSVLTVQQVNELIYNKVGLSKEEFHAAYPSANFSYSGDGVVNEKYSPDSQTTDTYLMNWTLTALDIWTKLIVSNPASFTATAIYTPMLPTVYPKITITFTRKFTKPADLNIAAAQLITNYWYPQAPGTTNAISTSASTAMPYNYVKHNIVVPNVGETNNALAIFSNNINQAFEQNANKSLKALSNYEYYFIANTLTPGATSDKFGMNDQSQPIMMVNGVKYQLTPSADGKSLMNGSDVVATINPFAANVGDVLTLNQASATAKLLLNAGPEFLKVRIAIRTVYCANLPQFKMPVTINGKPYMDVVFVRPINPQPAADQHFVDALNFGDQYTYLEIAKLTNLNDWRFSDPVASFATHFNYWSYYGITNITADVANIKTDLNQAAGVTVPLAQYPDLRVAYALTVPSVTNPAPTTPATFFGYLTYNNTGNTLGKLFNLYVPVTVTYSWGTIQSAQVVVPVWKTVGSAGVKAKK